MANRNPLEGLTRWAQREEWQDLFAGLLEDHVGPAMTAAKLSSIDDLIETLGEDSFNGLIAAKAARMKCVAIPVLDQAHLPKWGAAELQLNSLLEFTEQHLDQLQ